MRWWVKAKRAQSVTDDESWIEGGVAPTLNSFDSGDTRTTVIVYALKPGQSEAAGGPFVTEDVVPTLQAQNNGSTAVPAVYGFSHTQGLNIQPSESVWPTLGSGGGGQAVSQPTVRRLTPRECERLQGFPDDWTAGQADSHRYRQMGNAVTVNVAAYVGALIVDAMQHDAGGAA